MSLTTQNVAGTNLITAALSGTLTGEELTAALADIERVASEQGSVRLLLEYSGTSTVQPTSVLQEAGSRELMKKIDRAAIVTDVSWLQGMAGAAGRFVPFEVKVYPVEQHGAALEWVTT